MAKRHDAQSRSHLVIRVHNRQRSVGIDLTALQQAADEALRHVLKLPLKRQTQLVALAEVDVVLVSDARMARLHRQFLNQTGPTDVITFDHGEIVISVDTTVKNARHFEGSLARELQLYIIHGLLHLQGFDDKTPAAARRMAALQDRILRRLAR